MSTLDQDFESTIAQINLKIKEAAVSLREANELREKVGLPALIYSPWTEEEDSSLEDLSKKDLKRLEDDEEWDGESSPLQMKIAMIDVSDLEDELNSAGWSTSSSYC